MKQLTNNLPIPPIYAMDSAIENIFICMDMAKKQKGRIVGMSLWAISEGSIKLVEFEDLDRKGFAKIMWVMQNDIPVPPLTDEQLKEMGIWD